MVRVAKMARGSHRCPRTASLYCEEHVYKYKYLTA